MSDGSFRGHIALVHYLRKFVKLHSLQQTWGYVGNPARGVILRATRKFLAEAGDDLPQGEGEAAETYSAGSKSDPMAALARGKVRETGRMNEAMASRAHVLADHEKRRSWK